MTESYNIGITRHMCPECGYPSIIRSKFFGVDKCYRSKCGYREVHE